VLGLDLVVVGLDDGFFAGEVIVGRAEGDIGGRSQVAHGGGVEAAFAKAMQGGGKDMGPSGLAFGSGRGCIEHVQIISKILREVKNNIEQVRIKHRNLLIY